MGTYQINFYVPLNRVIMVVDSLNQIVPDWLAVFTATFATENSVEWDNFTKTTFIEDDLSEITKQRSVTSVTFVT